MPRRAEVLKRTEAGDGVEAPERVAVNLAEIDEVHVEAMTAAGLRLRGGEHHPKPIAATLTDEMRQRPSRSPGRAS